MTYVAVFDEKRGWRVQADYTRDGGIVIDVGGAVSKQVAVATAVELNAQKLGLRVVK